MDFYFLLAIAIDKHASDLHLSSGLPPLLRVDGSLLKLDLPILEQTELRCFLQDLMDQKQNQIFQEQLEIDFTFQLNEKSRFRVHIFKQARGISAVFRNIPSKIKTLEELGLPLIFKELASCPKGLILVTGPAGAGKSTTLAAIINYINLNFYKHIITIEDPIEFIYTSERCLIHQREIGRDVHSFDQALRSVLREDPNIILLGELRDYQTIRLAMTAAETGHLVFSTLHTRSATKTINRIIDAVPGNEKVMIRALLSESLHAVIAQTLLKKITGGRIPAFEIMICTPAIRNLIREDKISQIQSSLQTGQKIGMQTLEQDLTKLIANQLITEETAAQVSIS